MFEVDRIAAIIRPTTVMLEWVKEHPAKFDHVTLKNLQEDCVVLLIPPFDGPRQAQEFVKQIYKGIMEAELISWGIPEEHWPKDRSIALFHRWFNIEYHSSIYDVMYLQQEKLGEPA